MAGADVPRDNSAVYVIYLASAVRLVAFVSFLWRPLRLGAQIASDVTMYVSPRRSTNYGAAARARFNVLLRHLQAKHGEAVTVLAYSQGSIVSLEAIRESEARNVALVTAGSPIDALYGDFLKHRQGGDVLQRLSSWTNFFRLSDFSGGPIALAQRNVAVLQDYERHHLGYFSAREIIAAL